MNYSFDDLHFETSYWYGDVDLYRLEEIYGLEFMQKLYFHIMAFEANKLVSLCPQSIDFGLFAEFVTPQFEALWRTIVHKVWAQCRYENDLPFYQGPVFKNKSKKSSVSSIENTLDSVEVLSFCGGGKDSLVAMKLLERGGIDYATFAYSNSVYGPAHQQHQLIYRLLQHGTPANQHQQWVYDSFIDAPVLALHPEVGVKSIAAAETPASIFGALPVVLQHGYRFIALAHERSANVGNLTWDVTGEEVNHQWGKSYQAEVLLNDYIQTELISNFSYFSLLQPIYDVVIFNLLRRDLDAVPDTHSCNLRKPWCCRCPKCAYVWLNYMAYLPVDLVNSVFNVNLFDLEENQGSFRQMLGLAEHTPFECIGQVPETRLAFELCKRKGLPGRAMDLYSTNFPNLDIPPIIDKYLHVESEKHGMANHVCEKIISQMQEASVAARSHILSLGKEQ
ncbi:MAG: hypothetical protein ACE5I1_10135 [bacterium]